MKYSDFKKTYGLTKKAEDEQEQTAPAESTQEESQAQSSEVAEEQETDDTKQDDSSNEVIKMLCKILADEYVSYYAYFAGAKNIRGENWMDVKQEFEQHAEDERGHFEEVFDRLYQLGYYNKDLLKDIEKNAGYYWDVDTMDPKKAAEIAREAERKAVDAYQQLLVYLHGQSPDKMDYATEKLAKEHLATEQDHLQDMERLVEEF